MTKKQTILESKYLYENIIGILKQAESKKPFLVCGHSFMKHPVYQKLLAQKDYEFTTFHDYEPNPKYESVVKAVESFQENGCDFLISVGGGSPMDVTKSIKAFCNMPKDQPYILQTITPNKIPHLAIPTTAGTGSESTHFAVIYYEGKKYSVSEESFLPEYVVLDASLLNGLSKYQRKATMLDALCHAIESFWSVKSSEESRKLSETALKTIMECYDAYLENTEEGNKQMLYAANLSGQAINLTTTTAAHAMCYKLTSIYGIAHGHAAALCLPKLWKYMIKHPSNVQDERGQEYVEESFAKLAEILGCKTPEEAVVRLETMITSLGLDVPQLRSEEELEILASSVNLQRLSNNPVALSEEDLKDIYRTVLKERAKAA